MTLKRAVAILGSLLPGAAAFLALWRLRPLAWLRVDWAHFARWAAAAPLDDIVAATVRLLALTCTYWLLGSSLLHGLARLTRLPDLIRATEWVTLPFIRRLVDRVLPVALATSTVIAGWAVSASAATAHRGPVILKLAAAPTSTPPPPLPTPPVTPTPTPTPSPTGTPGYVPTPAGNGSQPGPSSPSMQPTSPNPSRVWTTHRVVRGDNLWKISAEHLAETLGLDRRISNRRIATYWLRVVAVNRASLRSGDPDLIYPGEIVNLPPIVQPVGDGG